MRQYGEHLSDRRPSKEAGTDRTGARGLFRTRLGAPILLALLLCSSGGFAAEQPERPRLNSKDEIAQIRALLALAEEGAGARRQEVRIAVLMTESAKGKRLSRWCYFALEAVSDDPGKYLKRYMEVARWQPRSGLRPNEIAVRHGPPPKEPALPADLQAASNRAWKVCVRAVLSRWRGEKDRRARGRLRRFLHWTEAPPGVVLPLMTGLLGQADASVEEKCAAAELAARHGFRAKVEIKELYEFLGSKDARLRAAGATALSTLYYDNCPSLPPPHPAPGKAIDALARATGDADVSVRSAAAYGLHWMGYQARSAVPVLVARLGKEPIAAQRRALLSALSFIGGLEDAGPVIIRAVKEDPDAVTRRSAARALGWLASHLQGRKQDKEWAALAKDAVPLLIKQFKDDPKMGWNLPAILAEFDQHAAPAVPFLHERLRKSSNVSVKGRCVFALGRIGPAARAAVPDILKCMAFREIRFGVSFVLGRIGVGGKDVEGALLELVKSHDRHTRREAAESLGKVAEESAKVTAALKKLLDDGDEDEDVRAQARKAIAAIRDRAEAKKQPEVF